MAGHSHSSNIKFRKARVDQLRAKAFTKLARMITVAAKLGGGDPDANPRLRLAVEKARLISVPRENIERAIKKGTGGLDGVDYEELQYEGFGPGGVAILLEVLTDNRHRTAAELRQIFEKGGGNLGATGAVAWMFERRAIFPVAGAEGPTEEQLLSIALDAGAQDLVVVPGGFEVHGEPSAFLAIKSALEAASIPTGGGALAYVTKTKTDVTDPALARKVIGLLDALDDLDDVQNCYANHEFTEAVVAALEQDA